MSCTKREELEAFASEEHSYGEYNAEMVYLKTDVDSVMNTMEKDYEDNRKLWEAEIASLKEHNKELEASQPKWISVKDKLPKEDDEILFTDGEFIYKGCWTTWDGGCSDFSYVVGSGFVDEVNDESFTEEQITHWMPLPEAPRVSTSDTKSEE